MALHRVHVLSIWDVDIIKKRGPAPWANRNDGAIPERRAFLLYELAHSQAPAATEALSPVQALHKHGLPLLPSHHQSDETTRYFVRIARRVARSDASLHSVR